MKLATVIERVENGPPSDGMSLVNYIVRRTIAELGLEVARDGEVYNPAPPPAPITLAPQMNARKYGGRRRS